MIESVNVQSPLGKSDHCCLQWNQFCYRESEKQTHEGNRLDYRKAEFEKIKEKIDSVNWRREFRDTDIKEAWKLFRTVYEDTVKTCVPVRKVKVNNRPPWLTAHVKRSLREKYRALAI